MALTVKIRGNATHFEKTMRGVEGSVGKLGSSMLKLGAAGAGFAAAMAGISTAGAGIEKIGAWLKDSSAQAASLETLKMDFETLTGSGKTAAEMIQAFRDEATKSPLSASHYAQAGKTLLAFGSEAKDVLPTLKTLGDVSMGNSERFASLALAFAQTNAAGRLMGGELNQLINAGFSPLQQISKKTGESMVSLKKRMEDGGITVDMVKKAFTDATSAGGIFYKAIEKGATTTEGKLAKLKDSMDTLKIAFGTGMNDGLGKFFTSAADGLGALEGNFKNFGETAGLAITQSLQGNAEIFRDAGLLLGQYLKAGAMTGLEKLWTDAGVKVANMFGAGLKNESAAEIFQRKTGGIEIAKDNLASSISRGGYDQATMAESRRQKELAYWKRITDELILLNGATKEGSAATTKALQELATKPMTSR